MAITRHERRELDRAGSRHLRSGKRLQTLPATPLLVRGSGYTRKARQSGSMVVAHPDVIAEEATPEQSQRQEEGQRDHTVPSPSSMRDWIRPQTLAMEVDKYALHQMLSLLFY
jgi:hypothetical protein